MKQLSKNYYEQKNCRGVLLKSYCVISNPLHVPRRVKGQLLTIEHFKFHREANNWSWVPVVGCFLGGILGSLIYICLIEMHHGSENDGETGYELECIVTTMPESKPRGNEIGKKNMALNDGIIDNKN